LSASAQEDPMIDSTTADAFRTALRGQPIRPGDPAYDAARKVHNGMIDRRPGLIAQVADVADVVRAVQIAAERDIGIAVRGGGHSAGGMSVCDDELVIDLRG